MVIVLKIGHQILSRARPKKWCSPKIEFWDSTIFGPSSDDKTSLKELYDTRSKSEKKTKKKAEKTSVKKQGLVYWLGTLAWFSCLRQVRLPVQVQSHSNSIKQVLAWYIGLEHWLGFHVLVKSDFKSKLHQKKVLV